MPTRRSLVLSQVSPDGRATLTRQVPKSRNARAAGGKYIHHTVHMGKRYSLIQYTLYKEGQDVKYEPEHSSPIVIQRAPFRS